MSNVFDEFAEQPKKRTTFITVLCILTFVGSGFSLFTNIYGYFTAKQSAEQMQLVQKMAQSDTAFAHKKGKSASKDSLDEKQSKEFTKKIFSSVATAFTEDNLKKNALGAIAAAILCLGGAVLMFMINKKGYFIYVAGTLLGIAIPLMLYGSNFVGILGSVVSGFFGLVFCILYGVNLKDMK
jgi:ABC-type multidrug transport system fused ATPase/permease subunit